MNSKQQRINDMVWELLGLVVGEEMEGDLEENLKNVIEQLQTNQLKVSSEVVPTRVTKRLVQLFEEELKVIPNHWKQIKIWLERFAGWLIWGK